MSSPWVSREAAKPSLCAISLLLTFRTFPAMAGDPDAAAIAAGGETQIVVTASKQQQDRLEVPSSISVVTAAELQARHVTDLPSALTLVAGVAVAPGGDGGPASSVPELWGLREFDAFLLVVDGVPWGGAFLPALNAVDLEGVERIEVLRGAAPVMYGATSFVGVIHVIHLAASDGGERTGSVRAGQRGSWGLGARIALPAAGSYHQSLTAGHDRRELADDRAGFDRTHLLYRGVAPLAGGEFHVDADLLRLRQDPASPHPRDGLVLTDLIPLDANHNPSDARLDDDRVHLTLGFERRLARSRWVTTLAATRTTRETTRGFLQTMEETPENARGYDQRTRLTEVYFDSHLVTPVSPQLDLISGADVIFGKGTQESRVFDYFAALDGSRAEPASEASTFERNELEDERTFAGLYAQAEWRPTDGLRAELGARLNRTQERLEGGADEGGAEQGEERGSDERTKSRVSGVLGLSARLWHRDRDALWAFIDWRDTYKPAVVDFGPEAEADLLEPETSQSWECGIKGVLAGGRVDVAVSGFRLDLEDVVVNQIVDGTPALTNAGRERFEGVELEFDLKLREALRVQATFARHEARLRDFLTQFDGVPTQLRGNRFEMSPRTLASAAISYAPAQGPSGYVSWNYTGDRYLNKRNTALAASFAVVSTGIGWRWPRVQVELDGLNLTDERDPVAESELGDAQYYRQPARTIEGSVRFLF